MSVTSLAWVGLIVGLARILNLRLAFAAPGVTLTIPVPLAILAALAAAIVITMVLACRSILAPGAVRSRS